MNDNLSNSVLLNQKDESSARRDLSGGHYPVYLTTQCWSKLRSMSLGHVQDIAQFALKTLGQRPEPRDGP